MVAKAEMKSTSSERGRRWFMRTRIVQKETDLANGKDRVLSFLHAEMAGRPRLSAWAKAGVDLEHME